MSKLGRYLKRYWLAILCIVGLLYFNAQAELALPNYMSQIITTGIQAGGIEDGVMEAIDTTNYDHLLIFMDETQQTVFTSSYERQGLDEQLSKTYPSVENEIYVLKDNIERTALSEAMGEAVLLNYVISNASNSEEFSQMIQNIPDGMDIYTFLNTIPDEQKNMMKEKMVQQIEAMGNSAMGIATANAVRELYQTMGRNTDEIQMHYILFTGLEMLGVAVLGTIAFITVTFLASKTAASVSRVLRNDVFSRVSTFGNSEFNQFSTASLITRTTNDIQQIQMVITMLLRIVIYAPIMGIGAMFRVADTGAGMTWIIVLTIVILLAIIVVTYSIVLPKFKISQKIVDKLNLVTRENLSGMMVIRAFGNQKESEERFDQANQDMTNLNLFVNRVMNSVMPLMTFILNGIMLLIIWIGAKQIDLGYTNIGDMMAFMQYAMQIIMAFVMVSMVFVMLPRARVACDRVFEVLETTPSISDPKKTQAFDETKRGLVEFDHVDFVYPGADEAVLHDITFTAKPGETTAIIGSTGSGKSTIIQLIPRFFDVSSGAIRVDGIDVRNVKMRDLRDRIGMILQKGVLFTGTIASNLRFGNQDADETRLQQAIKISQAEEFVCAKKEGLASEITQGGTNVSGGQKQRLAIARALVKDPEIYVFDDSFSALDFKTDAKLRKALNEMTSQKQSTVIIVGQRISTIMNADNIIVLDEGTIVGQGTHQELMKNCEVYQEIAYSQLSKEELSHE